MRKNIILPLTVLAFVTCGGCGSNGEDTDSRLTFEDIAPPSFTGGSGRNILTGEQLGDGTKLNSDLVYTAPVISNTYDFFIGPAYVSGETSSQIIIPITNIGPAKCNIKANLIELRDSRNNIIDSDTYGNYVTGSNATFYLVDLYQYINDRAYDVNTTNTCLDMGETGYFLHLNGGPARRVASVTVYDIESQEHETCSEAGCSFLTFYAPKQSWESISYNVTSPNSFVVSILNTSSKEASCCIPYSQYILLDENNIPLRWGFLDGYDTSNIPPLGTGQIIENIFYFEGISTKMEVFLRY